MCIQLINISGTPLKPHRFPDAILLDYQQRRRHIHYQANMGKDDIWVHETNLLNYIFDMQVI